MIGVKMLNKFVKSKSDKKTDMKEEIRLKLLMQQHGDVTLQLESTTDEKEILALLKKVDLINAQKVNPGMRGKR